MSVVARCSLVIQQTSKALRQQTAQCSHRSHHPWMLSPLSIQKSCHLHTAAPLLTERIEQDPRDAPLKYSTSRAHDWRSAETFTVDQSKRSYHRAFAIWFGTASFLIYFCILREENDIDEMLAQNLYDQVPGLEESTLRSKIIQNSKMGIDTTDLRKRLAEIEAEKAEGKRF